MNPHVDHPIAPITAVISLLLACNGQLAVVDDLNTQGADLEGVSASDSPSGPSDTGDPASQGPSCVCASSDSLQALGCGSGEVPLLDNDIVQSSRDGSAVAFDLCAPDGSCTVFHWNGSGPAIPIASGLLIGFSASGDQLLIAGASVTGGVLRVSPSADGSTPIATSIAVEMVQGHGSLSAAGDRVVGVVYGEDSVQLARAHGSTGQVEALGEIEGFIVRAYVNPDATAIVGFSMSSDRYTDRAFRWDERGLRFGLPGVSEQLGAWPEAVSADGSVIAGRAVSTTAHFRWSEAEGYVELASASWRSETSISADGSVVLGSLDPDGVNDTSAFRWTATTGAAEIAPGVATLATDMSDDGNVVVATSWEDAQLESPPASPQATYVWDSVHGTRSLTDILGARGADLSGWQLGHARVLSGNGKVLFGRALCGGVPALYRVVLSD